MKSIKITTGSATMLLSTTYAPLWKRAVAFFVDNLVIQIIASLLATVLNFNLAGIIYIIYFVYLHYKYGQTLGKKIFNIQVSFEQDNLQLLRVIVRDVIIKPITMITILGWLIGVFHSKKKTLHDLVSGSYVEDISIEAHGFNFLKASAIGIVMFMLMIGGSLYYSLNSQTVLHSLMVNMSRLQGFEFEEIKGTLASDISVKGFKYEREDIDINVKNIDFNIYEAITHMENKQNLLAVPFVSIEGLRVQLKKDLLSYAQTQKKDKKTQKSNKKSKNKSLARRKSNLEKLKLEYVGISDVEIYDKTKKQLFQLDDFIMKDLLVDIKKTNLSVEDVYFKNAKGHAQIKQLTANKKFIKSKISLGIKKGFTPKILSDLNIYGNMHFDLAKKQINSYHLLNAERTLQIYYKDKAHNLYLNKFALNKYFKSAREVGLSHVSAFGKSQSIMFLPAFLSGHVRLLNQNYKYQAMSINKIGVKVNLPALLMGEFSDAEGKRPFIEAKRLKGKSFQNFINSSMTRTPASQNQELRNFIKAVYKASNSRF